MFYYFCPILLWIGLWYSIAMEHINSYLDWLEKIPKSWLSGDVASKKIKADIYIKDNGLVELVSISPKDSLLAQISKDTLLSLLSYTFPESFFNMIAKYTRWLSKCAKKDFCK